MLISKPQRSRNGYDWTNRHPGIVEGCTQESDEAIHHRSRRRSSSASTAAPILMPCIPGKHDEEVQLHAFDMLAGRRR
jgi:hypothetical protein